MNMLALETHAATPARSLRELAARLAGLLRARWRLSGCSRGARVWLGGRVRIEARGDLRVGERVQLMGGIIPSELLCAAGAELILGARCLLNYGVSIDAVSSVRIGARTQIGSMARIRDSDGRAVAPVVIGEGVWIAHGAIIEPGVHIGDGAVISAGSVVMTDVPARSIAAGNPARAVPIDFFSRRRPA